MIVKNIIKTSAEYLGMKDIVKYLNDEIDVTDEIEDEVKNFVLAVNMVNNNIASSYMELVDSSEITNFSNPIKYTTISDKSIIEIKSVKTLSGDSVEYKVRPDGVYVEENTCVVEFSYYPDRVELDSEINHYLKVNEMTIALGVIGEYLYIKGAIDDAYMWDKRFKSAMFNLLRPKRNIIMPTKRWE